MLTTVVDSVTNITIQVWTQHSGIWSWSPPADYFTNGFVAKHNMEGRAKDNMQAVAAVKADKMVKWTHFIDNCGVL